METTHRIVTGDSRSLSRVETDSVELVVTSPPYPMIEMWDGVFSDLDPEIADLLEAGKGKAAFSRMHEKLAKVWNEVRRVLVDGGITRGRNRRRRTCRRTVPAPGAIRGSV